MVYVDHSASGLDTSEVLKRCERAGVLVSSRPPAHVRLVTHRHIDAASAEEALRRMRQALAGARAEPAA